MKAPVVSIRKTLASTSSPWAFPKGVGGKRVRVRVFPPYPFFKGKALGTRLP